MSKRVKYQTPSPLQPIVVDWAKNRNLQFYVKRDDLIHPSVSGNKWRKLKFNLLQAKHLQKSGVLTFGGAFSNHILATAHACRQYDLQSLALIRGEELNENSNAILQQCAKWGMKFHFISREEYNLKDDYEYLNDLKSEYRDFFIVPEGGKNFFGIVGCQEIINEIDIHFDAIWVAQGTCTTSIGLAIACLPSQKVHGVPVLKGFDAISEMVTVMKRQGFNQESVEDVLEKVIIQADYHFGGYGKWTSELEHFIVEMYNKNQLPLDKIYTAKAFYGMLDYYRNTPVENQKIIFLHTGGLVAGKV